MKEVNYVNFLKLIDSDAERFIITAFHDRDKQTNPVQLFIPPEEIKNNFYLMNVDGGFGVFFAVNEFAGSKRRNIEFKRARAVFCEFDLGEDKIPKWPIQPNIIVNSSPGKYHFYWLTSTENAEEWNGVQKLLVSDYGGDKQARDLSRVLRLPGSYHNKRDKFLVTYELIHSGKYTWDEIKKAFPVKPVAADNATKQESDEQSKTIIEHNIDIIQAHHFHGPTIAYLQMLKDGTPPYVVKASLKAMFETSVAKDETHDKHSEWLKAYNSIDYQVDEYSKILDVNDDVVVVPKDKEEIIGAKLDVQWPPGLMGEMCREAYEMARYPNKIVAIMSCITLVAGIIGRRYNINGTGLNLYSTILMDTGMGKNIIKDMVDRTLFNASGLNTITKTYKGASSFTGAKGLWDDLQTGYCKICVMTEAGLMRGQTAGDKKGLERAILDLYTSSAYNQWVGGTQYSSSDNSLKQINAPALSIIQESTPKSFIDAMKANNSDLSGDLARMWIMRINSAKPYMQRNPRVDFSKGVMSRIKSLIDDCSKVQLKPKMNYEDVKFIKLHEFAFDEADKFVDLENQYKLEGQHLKQIMTSRAWVKIVKIAAIIAVMNGLDYVDEETFNWANNQAIANEVQNIDILFSEGDSSNLDNMITMVVAPAIVKILNCKFNDLKKVPQKSLRERGIFTYSNIDQCLKNNRTLSELDDRPGGYKVDKGLNKVLQYMCKIGLLIELDSTRLLPLGSRAKKAYKITDDFNIMVG